MARVDSAGPVAVNVRSKRSFQPRIGPHSEADVVRMVLDDLRIRNPSSYASVRENVSYPDSRQKCDVCFQISGSYSWAYEVKLLRFLGDNGKPNDNMLMHILSPYPADRSALTDCCKLVETRIAARSGVLIFGYEDLKWPLQPAISAFERLASERVRLINRTVGGPIDLIHPVHHTGAVFGWEVASR